MKKTLYTLTIAAVAMLTAVSCVKLDTPPYDRETDLTFWSEDPESAYKATNSCYGYIASFEEYLLSEGATDNAYVKGLGSTQPIGNGSYSTDNSYVKSAWDFRYAGIRACNELLNNIHLTPNLGEELKNRYIGEVKTIRAFIYWELLTRFGGVPYTEDVLSVAQSRSISRASREVVLKHIIDDLTEVINGNYLPESYTGDNRGRITHGAAMAILAKVHLFEGNFDEVKRICNDIMESGAYDLFPSYSGLFELANEYNCEVILDVQYTLVSREHNVMYSFVPPTLGGYSDLAPIQELCDSYIMLNGKKINEAGSGYDINKPWDNRDPRLKATVMYTGNSYTLADGSEAVIDCDNGRDGYGTTSDVSATGYYLKKWWDNKYRLTLHSGLNPIIIRYADILLMYAEACVETSSMSYQVWNKTVRRIRERAGFTEASALDYPSGNLREIIRNERRSELAFEASRIKDIYRWKTAETALKGFIHGIRTGATVGADNGYVRIENRNFNADKHYLWPIPQKDRDLNKNLEQNPNW